MSVLSRAEILKEMKEGNINVSPYDESSLGCASIDLKLSSEFRYYTNGSNSVIYTEKITLEPGKPYLLLPGQACLGITEETVSLSPKLCGLLEGRSRFARLGLFVHITAGFMNPGISNRQVLEIYNASNNALQLWPGTKICQFIFLKLSGEAEYKGKFAVQNQL